MLLHLIFRRVLNPWKPANLAAESTVNEGSADSGTKRGFVLQAACPRGRRECACAGVLGICASLLLLVPAVSSSLFFPVHLCYSLLRIELQRTSQAIYPGESIKHYLFWFIRARGCCCGSIPSNFTNFDVITRAKTRRKQRVGRLFRTNPRLTTVPWTRSLSTHRQRCCRQSNWLSLPADPPPSARPVPSLLVTSPCQPVHKHTQDALIAALSRCTRYTTHWHYHPSSRLQKTRTSPPL
ncbi:hypothetical protein C8R45DRAFT_966149, partial [Mycena sanguinolenta]